MKVKFLFIYLSVGVWSDWCFASEKIQTISFESEKETIQAHWVLPEGSNVYPAVILIHEWWGLNPWIDQKALELSKSGYAVLAVDLYRGRSTKDAEEAHELMRGMPEDRALRDLSAAIDFLKKQKSVRSDKIGVMGWCMGGGYALKMAVQRSEIAACVIYYGSLLTDESSLSKVQASVIGFFGAEDRGIPVASIQQFEQTMKKLKKRVQIQIYKEAGHAFMNEEKASYREIAAVDSWKKTLNFLQMTLKDEVKSLP